MIIDYKKAPGIARLYSILDAETGECLDRERIFFADDEAGYYHRHLLDESGEKWVWDSRTKARLTGTFADPRNPVPDECKEVAWERVDRRIRIVRKAEMAADAGHDSLSS